MERSRVARSLVNEYPVEGVAARRSKVIKEKRPPLYGQQGKEVSNYRAQKFRLLADLFPEDRQEDSVMKRPACTNEEVRDEYVLFSVLKMKE